MTGYYYLDVELKLLNESDSKLAVFIKGSIEESLRNVFGEIGGLTTLDILKFDENNSRIILRVPDTDYVKVRSALTLIGTFQNIPCHFQVHSASPVLLSLIGTHLKFD